MKLLGIIIKHYPMQKMKNISFYEYMGISAWIQTTSSI